MKIGDMVRFLHDRIGRCPFCRGCLVKIADDVGRKWAVCLDCNLGIPLTPAHFEASELVK